jgi:hypothetical protein
MAFELETLLFIGEDSLQLIEIKRLSFHFHKFKISVPLKRAAKLI